MSVPADDYERWYRQEQQRFDDWNHFQTALTNLTKAAVPLWEQGDGYGGTVMNAIRESFYRAGLKSKPDPTHQKQGRKKIPGHVRTEVYERDLYRCVQCGTHLKLTLDHIVPWSKGGTDTPDNLQTLCQPCNSRKWAN